MAKQLPTAEEMIAHLWKRCRNMASGDYHFFKQLSLVVTRFHKDLSKKQRKYLVGYYKQYGSSKVTPKPKKKSQLNPWN